jgi:hypothetical protein
MDLIDIGISQGELKKLILLIAKKKAKNLLLYNFFEVANYDLKYRDRKWLH